MVFLFHVRGFGYVQNEVLSIYGKSGQWTKKGPFRVRLTKKPVTVIVGGFPWKKMRWLETGQIYMRVNIPSSWCLVESYKQHLGLFGGRTHRLGTGWRWRHRLLLLRRRLIGCHTWNDRWRNGDAMMMIKNPFTLKTPRTNNFEKTAKTSILLWQWFDASSQV